MRFRVRVSVRWFSDGPLGPGASWPIGGAQGTAQRNIRFRADSKDYEVRIRVRVRWSCDGPLGPGASWPLGEPS